MVHAYFPLILPFFQSGAYIRPPEELKRTMRLKITWRVKTARSRAQDARRNLDTWAALAAPHAP